MSRRRYAWLTPDEYEGAAIVRRPFVIPVPLAPYIAGALALLTEAENWEQSGELSPETMAERMAALLATWQGDEPGSENVLRATILRQTQTFGVATDFYTILPFDLVEYDTLNLWDDDNPDIIMIDEAGLYDINAWVVWNAAVGGQRRAVVNLVSAGITETIAQDIQPGATTALAQTCHAQKTIELQPGEFIYMQAYQNTGATVTLLPRRYGTVFSVVKLA